MPRRAAQSGPGRIAGLDCGALRLNRIGWTNRQHGELFDRLVRRAVFTEKNGVVGEDVDVMNLRERGEAQSPAASARIAARAALARRPCPTRPRQCRPLSPTRPGHPISS
jgi:hypothetical protein